MLNEKKIRLMTKLAVFEDKAGKEDLKISKYYRTDYIRFHLLKTLLCATIGYLLILALTAAYYSEFMIAKAVVLDYKSLLEKTIGIYLILAVCYAFLSIVIYSIRFKRSRKKLRVYKKNLKELRSYYKESETDAR